MPQKIDGPIELIQYGKKFPLEKELEYFINSLDGSPLKIANAKQGLDVVEILVKSSKQLLVWVIQRLFLYINHLIEMKM